MVFLLLLVNWVSKDKQNISTRLIKSLHPESESFPPNKCLKVTHFVDALDFCGTKLNSSSSGDSRIS